jgi:hypothetical protein
MSILVDLAPILTLSTVSRFSDSQNRFFTVIVSGSLTAETTL